MEASLREKLLRIYAETKTIAVVGASADETKASYHIPRYLQSQGYRIIPVNPRGGEILREPVFRSLSEIDVPVDVVDVFRPAQEAPAIARQAIAIGAKVLWLQIGIESDATMIPGLLVPSLFYLSAGLVSLRREHVAWYNQRYLLLGIGFFCWFLSTLVLTGVNYNLLPDPFGLFLGTPLFILWIACLIWSFIIGKRDKHTNKTLSPGPEPKEMSYAHIIPHTGMIASMRNTALSKSKNVIASL